MRRNKSKHYNSYKRLGQNIRLFRLQKELSQEELAFRVSTARNYLGCIERAEKIPSITLILDIAEALECTIKDLCDNV